MKSIISVCLLALVVGGCQTGTQYPGGIEFDNPSCQDVDVYFSEKDSRWVGSVTVPNVISNDEKLERVTVIDRSGDSASSVVLIAPESDGHDCAFHYPASLGGATYSGNNFERTTSGSVSTYTAENASQRKRVDDMTVTVLNCPVEEHLGNWTLEVEYPGSQASSTFRRTFEVCFEFERRTCLTVEFHSLTSSTTSANCQLALEFGEADMVLSDVLVLAPGKQGTVTVCCPKSLSQGRASVTVIEGADPTHLPVASELLALTPWKNTRYSCNLVAHPSSVSMTCDGDD